MYNICVQMDNERRCPVCSILVKGRSDKIFCSTKCRSINQYENRQQTEAFYLMEEGFDPKFFTHYWKNQKGDVYLFVYEYGFLKLTDKGKDKYVLVIWQDYMNTTQ